MRKNVCTSYVRRTIRQYLLIGSAALAAGVLLAALTVSGPPLTFFVLNFGQNSVYIAVILILTGSGAYLLFSGARGLLCPETADLCRFLRAGLEPEEAHLTGRELLALADRDLEGAAAFACGNVLVGREWLFVQNAWGRPVIRLKDICGVRDKRNQDGKCLLKFMDRQGAGPVTRELSAAEADVLRAFLNYHRGVDL